jgi:hypothetical protein
MEFKQKDLVSGSIFLLLIIVVSQTKLLSVDDILGRTLLVAAVLAISYTNKIMGVASVLMLIIAFSGITEGLENETPELDANLSSALDAVVKKDVMQVLKKKKDLEKSVDTPVEGFDLLHVERNLQKGKRSAAMHGAKHSSGGDVAPYDMEATMYSQIR